MISEAWLVHLGVAYGGWIVFAFVMMEGAGIPVPSESMLMSTVALASAHEGASTSVITIIMAAAAGAIVGDNIGYGIGRSAGVALVDRFGRLVGLTPRRRRLGLYLFDRYGGRLVFVARFVSVLRTCVSVLAGINHMSWKRFFVCNALGAAVWATVVGGSACVFGREVAHLSWPALMGLSCVVVLVCLGAAILVRREERTLQAEADVAVLPGDPPAARCS